MYPANLNGDRAENAMLAPRLMTRGLVLCSSTLREQMQRKNGTFLSSFSIRPLLSVNFYLHLPVLHLQPQNHILNANRAAVIDPWCV